MWDYFLQDWHLRLQHKIQTDRPVWCRDKAGVQSMLAADQVVLSASEIRSQHEMVVLSHLQSGSMDGGCKRRLIILLADAQVLAPQGAVSVVGLQPGFELRSRRGLHATKTEERFSLRCRVQAGA